MNPLANKDRIITIFRSFESKKSKITFCIHNTYVDIEYYTQDIFIDFSIKSF